MEKPLIFCMVPCCLLPDWEYLVISDFWKKKPADLRIKTSSLRDNFLGLQVSVGTNLVLHFNGSVYKPRTFTP